MRDARNRSLPRATRWCRLRRRRCFRIAGAENSVASLDKRSHQLSEALDLDGDFIARLEPDARFGHAQDHAFGRPRNDEIARHVLA